MPAASRATKPTVRYFSKRRKKGRARASPQQIVALRLNDFAILFRARYGGALPDDDSGRDDIEPVIHHIAGLTQAARRAEHWLDQWAPWLTLAEKKQVIVNGMANARAWKADHLAWRYRVTKEERALLGLSTIGAIDEGKAARTKRRNLRAREAKRAKRMAAGAKPRAEYEAAAIARAKPWIAEGVSRRTWYRRQALARGTGPATP